MRAMQHGRRSRVLVLVAAQLCSGVAIGCAAAPRPRDTSTLLYSATAVAADAEARRSTTGHGTLTGAQLDLTGAQTTLDAVRRLRPEFLRGSARGATLGRPEVAMYLNNVYEGEISLLNTIPMSEIRDISFLHPTEAHYRFGVTCRCANGVILVTTRRAGGR